MIARRVEYVDIAKGLGILLVVWGHSSRFLFNEIYAFHMPLFFFLSGFFFKENLLFHDFMIKKVKSLLVPYFIFYSFTLFFYYTLLNITNRGDQMDFEALLGYIPFNNDIINFPLWFLYALFWMFLIYFCLRKYIGNNVLILGITVLMYVSDCILRIFDINLPCFMNRSIGGLIYMHLGFVCYNPFHLSDKLNESLRKKIILILLFVLAFSVLYFLRVKGSIESYLFSPFLALAGISLIMVLSMLIQSHKILSYLGKHSLVIFSLHLPLFEFSRPLAKLFFPLDCIGYDIIIFSTSLVLSVILGEVFMALFPSYLGKGWLSSRYSHS